MLGLVEDQTPHWDEVYYVINFHTKADMDRCAKLLLLTIIISTLLLHCCIVLSTYIIACAHKSYHSVLSVCLLHSPLSTACLVRPPMCYRGPSYLSSTTGASGTRKSCQKASRKRNRKYNEGCDLCCLIYCLAYKTVSCSGPCCELAF